MIRLPSRHVQAVNELHDILSKTTVKLEDGPRISLPKHGVTGRFDAHTITLPNLSALTAREITEKLKTYSDLKLKLLHLQPDTHYLTFGDDEDRKPGEGVMKALYRKLLDTLPDRHVHDAIVDELHEALQQSIPIASREKFVVSLQEHQVELPENTILLPKVTAQQRQNIERLLQKHKLARHIRLVPYYHRGVYYLTAPPHSKAVAHAVMQRLREKIMQEH